MREEKKKVFILDKINQDKTRQNKTRQDKTRQDKTRPDLAFTFFVRPSCGVGLGGLGGLGLAIFKVKCKCICKIQNNKKILK